MEYTRFIDKIKSHDVGGFYIFEGPEEYLAVNTLNMVKQEFLPKDVEQLNFTKFNGEEVSIKQVVDEINLLPFMAKKRIIFINNWTTLSKDLSDMFDDLEKYKDSYILILYSSPEIVRKNLSMYKKLKKYDRVISFDLVTDRQLKVWIRKKIENSEKSITDEALELFINYLNYGDEGRSNTLQKVDNQITKLRFLSCNEIGVEHISKLINQSVKTNIFNLTDAISNRNKKRACNEYKNLIDMGEEPIKILYMISRHISNILKIKFYFEQGKRDIDIIKILGISNFEYKKIASSIKKFSLEEAIRSLDFCVKADYDIKTRPGNAESTVFVLINRIIS